MPGTSTIQDVELVVEKKNGGGGGSGGGNGDQPPGRGGGDSDNDGKKPPRRQPMANRYYAGLAIGIVAILMFFMALASAFLIRKRSQGWRILEGQGIYIASNPASSFFYVFTGAHGLHLMGGVAALIYVAVRSFDPATITRTVAVDVAAYYWHFMDGLWLFLLALLVLGK